MHTSKAYAHFYKHPYLKALCLNELRYPFLGRAQKHEILTVSGHKRAVINREGSALSVDIPTRQPVNSEVTST